MYFYSTSSYSYSASESRYTLCILESILERRFALTANVYKYLNIGISVRLMSSVEMLLGDNKGNYIVSCNVEDIHRETCKYWFLQSTAPSSLSIQDLIVNHIKIQNINIIKLTLHDICLLFYMKPATILFLFELEYCVEHAYF